MNNPYLIIGYERSGTTLLRRIMSMCPHLDNDIVHENSKVLMQCRTKKEAVKKLTYPSKQAGKLTGGTMSVLAGQKIPYVQFQAAKKAIKKFKNLFGSISIIHIIRNPVGCINSQVKTFGRDPTQCIKRYFDSVPTVVKYLKESGLKWLEMRYEDLVTHPQTTISELYSQMGGEVSSQHIDEVILTRDPWEHNGRMMCGLRYFDSIEPNSSAIILNKSMVKRIKARNGS